jgi:hypothetical protein
MKFCQSQSQYTFNEGELVLILLTNNRGITYDELPQDVRTLVTQTFNVPGGVALAVSDESESFIRATLGNHGFGLAGENSPEIVNLTDTPTPGVFNVHEETEVDRINTGRIDEALRFNDQVRLFAGRLHATPVQTNATDIQYVPAPQDATPPVAQTELGARPHATMIVPTGGVSRNPQFNEALVPIQADGMAIAVASILGNETSSNARILRDKITHYNAIMAQLIDVQREINRLSEPIDNHPSITIVRESLTALRNDVLVDEAFITDTFIVIRSKEIVTERLPDISPRVIGRMEFRIKLETIFGANRNIVDPIIIRNLDRELVSRTSDGRSEGYQCPHVKLSGHACFGETLVRMLTSALAAADIVGVFDLLVRFVKNPNPVDAWGRNITMWPEHTVEHTVEGRF